MEFVDEDGFAMPPSPGTGLGKLRELAARDDDFETGMSARELGERADMFPMRAIVLSIPGSSKRAVFNPVTSLVGVLTLVGTTIYCMSDAEAASESLIGLRAQIARYFGWFYVGTTPLFIFLLIFLAIRYGDVRLGKDGEKAEFSDASYFTMLFSAGVAVGLFFFGVKEPLSHRSGHRQVTPGYRNEDEVDTLALNLTLYHWGLAGWAPYVLVALTAGLASYRFGLPMTLRSCFYPLMGNFVWGWAGDLIDGFTLVTVVSGVCTSLGLGVLDIVRGLQRLDLIDAEQTESELFQLHAITITAVTLVATVSVVSGLNYGIKVLSKVAFFGGCALCFLIFAMDNSKFLLNLMTSATGYYFQYSIFEIGFETDAFGQLLLGEGRSGDGKSASPSFMEGWTLFYWAWWTAWSSFVGLFIARISRGRTVREVVIYSLLAPLAYAIVWFSVFGGAGLRAVRVAGEVQTLGDLVFNDTLHFQVTEGTAASSVCFHPPTAESLAAEVSGLELSEEAKTFVSEYVNNHPSITPVCDFDYGEAWFNVLMQYPFGSALTWLSLFCITVYFITSSDSGSLIVDHLASNGHEEHHWAQRVFWAFTEGALAIALLKAGGSTGLGALQAASVICGLPYTVLLCFMCRSLWLFCDRSERITRGLLIEDSNAFKLPLFGGVFNGLELLLSMGRIPEGRKVLGMVAPTGEETGAFLLSLVAPPLVFLRVQLRLAGGNTLWALFSSAVYAACFLASVCLSFVALFDPNMWPVACLFIIATTAVLGSLRATFRARTGINGSLFEDFMCSSILYPQVLAQMIVQLPPSESATTAVAGPAEGEGEEDDEELSK